MDSNDTSMLPAFRIRRILPLEAIKAALDGIPQASNPTSDESTEISGEQDSNKRYADGIIRMRKDEYEELVTKQPRAALRYLDEDDGEVILVGSALELDQRLQEPIRKPRRSVRPSSSTLPTSSVSNIFHSFEVERQQDIIKTWADVHQRNNQHQDNTTDPHRPHQVSFGELSPLSQNAPKTSASKEKPADVEHAKRWAGYGSVPTSFDSKPWNPVDHVTALAVPGVNATRSAEMSLEERHLAAWSREQASAQPQYHLTDTFQSQMIEIDIRLRGLKAQLEAAHEADNSVAKNLKHLSNLTSDLHALGTDSRHIPLPYKACISSDSGIPRPAEFISDSSQIPVTSSTLQVKSSPTQQKEYMPLLELFEAQLAKLGPQVAAPTGITATQATTDQARQFHGTAQTSSNTSVDASTTSTTGAPSTNTIKSFEAFTADVVTSLMARVESSCRSLFTELRQPIADAHSTFLADFEKLVKKCVRVVEPAASANKSTDTDGIAERQTPVAASDPSSVLTSASTMAGDKFDTNQCYEQEWKPAKLIAFRTIFYGNSLQSVNQFLVRWVDHDSKEDVWCDESSLCHYRSLITAFLEENYESKRFYDDNNQGLRVPEPKMHSSTICKPWLGSYVLKQSGESSGRSTSGTEASPHKGFEKLPVTAKSDPTKRSSTVATKPSKGLKCPICGDLFFDPSKPGVMLSCKCAETPWGVGSNSKPPAKKARESSYTAEPTSTSTEDVSEPVTKQSTMNDFLPPDLNYSIPGFELSPDLTPRKFGPPQLSDMSRISRANNRFHEETPTMPLPVEPKVETKCLEGFDFEKFLAEGRGRSPSVANTDLVDADSITVKPATTLVSVDNEVKSLQSSETPFEAGSGQPALTTSQFSVVPPLISLGSSIDTSAGGSWGSPFDKNFTQPSGQEASSIPARHASSHGPVNDLESLLFPSSTSSTVKPEKRETLQEVWSSNAWARKHGADAKDDKNMPDPWAYTPIRKSRRPLKTTSSTVTPNAQPSMPSAIRAPSLTHRPSYPTIPVPSARSSWYDHQDTTDSTAGPTPNTHEPMMTRASIRPRASEPALRVQQEQPRVGQRPAWVYSPQHRHLVEHKPSSESMGLHSAPPRPAAPSRPMVSFTMPPTSPAVSSLTTTPTVAKPPTPFKPTALTGMPIFHAPSPTADPREEPSNLTMPVPALETEAKSPAPAPMLFPVMGAPRNVRAQAQQQMRLMLAEQEYQKLMRARQEQNPSSPLGAENSPPSAPMYPPAVGASGNVSAQAEYPMPIMLLEQQNKKRLMLSRQEQKPPLPVEAESSSAPAAVPFPVVDAFGNAGARADYQMQLMLLEQQNKERLMISRRNQNSSAPVEAETLSPVEAEISSPVEAESSSAATERQCAKQLIEMGYPADKALVVASQVYGELEMAIDMLEEDSKIWSGRKGKAVVRTGAGGNGDGRASGGARVGDPVTVPGSWDDELYG